jgi:hypothetical protein
VGTLRFAPYACSTGGMRFAFPPYELFEHKDAQFQRDNSEEQPDAAERSNDIHLRGADCRSLLSKPYNGNSSSIFCVLNAVGFVVSLVQVVNHL